ncbi:MAG: 1A family penicillin-binding protein [uncultured bacterium (gcode 4)]|uniref:peptidoglycan glycosyltransferase n=1 Tax=uncultured bacterium (gcode 4) TaxID=1234023 RepID=K2G0J2_9BACT|nr:MAG: 1A family penicillin-binding protein [uncultured bacterium (gcode 4)]
MNLRYNIRNKFNAIFFIFFIFIIFFVTSLFFVPLPVTEMDNSIIIFDRNNIEIWEIPHENKIRHRNLKFSEIPEFYKKILIYWEDKSFFYNYWISLKWLARSIINNLWSDPIQWASTISAQFIRNNLWLNEERWIRKKLYETYYSLILNLRYSKGEIIEKYVNQIYFSNLNYGLKSASIYYFWKEPSNLTKAEILGLFAIQKNSSKYDPYKKYENWRKRFEFIAKNLKDNSQITNAEYEDIVSEKIIFIKEHRDKLPYAEDFLQSVKKQEIPFVKQKVSEDTNEIKTTFDYDLTKKIEKIGENAIYELSWKNVKDYSVIIADRKTSEILVMIWWKNYYSQEWQVNSALALRQPWSTIKPFTYILADKILWLKPSDWVLDLPVSYQTKDWYSYEPQNYSTKFEWEVSAWEALAQSMNVPAVRTLEKVWVQNLLNFLNLLWITSLNKDADEYWLALTLWDGEVSLYELLRAYSIFSNDWKLCDFNFLKFKESSCKQIIEKKYTDDINDVLSSRFLKIWGYPINSALDFKDLNVFFKTWTSRNFRDNWTIGYSSNYLIWVWAWNKDASNMKWVSWATWAWEIFSRIVRNLEASWVRRIETSMTLNSKKYLEISSPLPNQLFKINKYLPSDKQKIKLSFSTNYKHEKAIWQLDGKNIDSDFLELSVWKHILYLSIMQDWNVIANENISFEVVDDYE